MNSNCNYCTANQAPSRWLPFPLDAHARERTLKEVGSRAAARGGVCVFVCVCGGGGGGLTGADSPQYNKFPGYRTLPMSRLVHLAVLRASVACASCSPASGHRVVRPCRFNHPSMRACPIQIPISNFQFPAGTQPIATMGKEEDNARTLPPASPPFRTSSPFRPSSTLTVAVLVTRVLAPVIDAACARRHLPTFSR